MADIIFLAIVAAFVIYKLKNTLGKDSGIDPRTLGRTTESAENTQRILSFPEKALREAAPEPDPSSYGDASVAQGLVSIKIADPAFNVAEFLSGAKTAFEWILGAFSKGEKQKLAQLLSDDVFAQFSRAIDELKTKNQTRETTLVSIVSQNIIEAKQDKNVARITLKFVTEQVLLIRDAEGKIIEGDPSDAQRVEDEWTFERDVTSKNPNWKIIAT